MFAYADRAIGNVIMESHQFSKVFAAALTAANRREFGIAYGKYISHDDADFERAVALVQKHFKLLKRGEEITF